MHECGVCCPECMCGVFVCVAYMCVMCVFCAEWLCVVYVCMVTECVCVVYTGVCWEMGVPMFSGGAYVRWMCMRWELVGSACVHVWREGGVKEVLVCARVSACVSV